MPEDSALRDVSRGHTHPSALADICAQHDYAARNRPSSSAPSRVLRRPSFNFRRGGETNSLDVLWHFGVNLSERSEGSKGEVVISAGTDTGGQSNRLVFDNKRSGVARRGSERRQVTEDRCPRWFLPREAAVQRLPLLTQQTFSTSPPPSAVV